LRGKGELAILFGKKKKSAVSKNASGNLRRKEKIVLGRKGPSLFGEHAFDDVFRGPALRERKKDAASKKAERGGGGKTLY